MEAESIDRLADLISEKVILRLNAMGFPVMSTLEVVLPSGSDGVAWSEWEETVFFPTVDEFMKHTAGRPDIGLVFFAAGALSEDLGKALGNSIGKVRDSWSHKDLECTLVIGTDVQASQAVRGVDLYKIYVERPEHFDRRLEGIEPSAVQAVIRVTRNNVGIMPEVLGAAAEKGCKRVSHQWALNEPQWGSEEGETYLEQLEALYKIWMQEDVSYYLFDSFHQTAQCEGATWGCRAGRDRACVLEDGTQLPCYLFSMVPELSKEYVLGNVADPFGNLEARRTLVWPQPPSEECISCDLARYCFGGCYLHRRKAGTAEFTRNPVLCAILKGELTFLKDKLLY